MPMGIYNNTKSLHSKENLKVMSNDFSQIGSNEHYRNFTGYSRTFETLSNNFKSNDTVLVNNIGNTDEKLKVAKERRNFFSTTLYPIFLYPKETDKDQRTKEVDLSNDSINSIPNIDTARKQWEEIEGWKDYFKKIIEEMAEDERKNINLVLSDADKRNSIHERDSNDERTYRNHNYDDEENGVYKEEINKANKKFNSYFKRYVGEDEEYVVETLPDGWENILSLEDYTSSDFLNQLSKIVRTTSDFVSLKKKDSDKETENDVDDEENFEEEKDNYDNSENANIYADKLLRFLTLNKDKILKIMHQNEDNEDNENESLLEGGDEYGGDEDDENDEDRLKNIRKVILEYMLDAMQMDLAEKTSKIEKLPNPDSDSDSNEKLELESEKDEERKKLMEECTFLAKLMYNAKDQLSKLDSDDYGEEDTQIEDNPTTYDPYRYIDAHSSTFERENKNKLADMKKYYGSRAKLIVYYEKFIEILKSINESRNDKDNEGATILKNIKTIKSAIQTSENTILELQEKADSKNNESIGDFWLKESNFKFEDKSKEFEKIINDFGEQALKSISNSSAEINEKFTLIDKKFPTDVKSMQEYKKYFDNDSEILKEIMKKDDQSQDNGSPNNGSQNSNSFFGSMFTWVYSYICKSKN